MNILKNQRLKSASGRDFAFDLYLPDATRELSSFPLLIFAHGFKGFKDWGHWEKIALFFVDAGYAFLKFNFSHNGTSVDHPLDFVDLEAFGQNNFSKELLDVEAIIDWLSEQASTYRIQPDDWTMIGHSRGGPIAILSAARHTEINRVITWAAVHELDYAWQDAEVMETWKNTGVRHILNGRTQQQMPMYYQIVADYEARREQLSVQAALKSWTKELLILHGTADPAVALRSAEYLKHHYAPAQLRLIEGANHVFGGKHPYEEEQLPTHSLELVNACLDFLKPSSPKP